MMPVRVQRKRTKGWRMPEGAVYVGRPTKWGNPFVVSRWQSAGVAVELFSMIAHGVWSPPAWMDDVDHRHSARARDGWLRRLAGHPIELARAELRGKDLVCWCPLSEPCHADVLRKLANG